MLEENFQKPTLKQRIKNFIIESNRVFKLTKKPSNEEFKTIAKVAGIGTLVIGFIGFLIHLISQLIK
ncbi:MAG: protein translocase SEC61 complex subunit gamma [Nanoarchaeota archaeon]